MDINVAKKTVAMNKTTRTNWANKSKFLALSMGSLKAFFAVVLLTLTLILSGASSALAAVYTCNVQDCNNWHPTTLAEFNNTYSALSSRPVTVQQVLGNSQQASIANGFANAFGTDLYIKKFWHKGGSLPMDQSYEHITVEVWKYDHPSQMNYYVKTCHAYPFTKDLGGAYQATCF